MLTAQSGITSEANTHALFLNLLIKDDIESTHTIKSRLCCLKRLKANKFQYFVG